MPRPTNRTRPAPRAARWTAAALLLAALLAPVSAPAAARPARPAPNKAIALGDLVLSLSTTKDVVAEYTPQGKHVQDLITLADGLLGPAGSAFDSKQNLFVADFFGDQVFERTAKGVVK